MAIIKCKMCGGDIVLAEDKTYGTCEYCGSTMTFPKVSDEQRLNLFNRANHFRRQNEFDKAIAAYDKILDQDDTDAEAHWGAVLSRYGIEYVEDPVTHERIPTCHRVQLGSILTDADYLAALEHAPDTRSRDIYESEAKRIADIQKGILAISAQEKPYDVFICYKETDDSGSRTKDSTLAQDIYYQLTNEGYKVFFSRITLEDKLGQQYEPYIFAALNSAKVMLVIGTRAEYFNAVWVKNEWNRYLDLMKRDRNKLLIPCYRDMDPYDLPEELSALQSQDMSKIGFMQDIIRGVKKVLNAGKEEKPAVVAVPTAGPGVASLHKRAVLFLEDGDWDSASEYFDRILDIDPEYAPAYIGKVQVTNKVRKEDGLARCAQPLKGNPDYQKALRFASEQQKAIYEGYNRIIEERLERERKEAIYREADAFEKRAATEADFLVVAKKFDEAGEIRDARERAANCRAKAVSAKQAAERQAEEYRKQLEREREERKRQEEEARKEAEHKAEQERIEAEKRAEQERIEAEKRARQERIEAEKRKKRNRIVAAAIAAILVVTGAAFVVNNKVIQPKNRYNAAQALLEEGKFDEAAEAFTAMEGYSDSADKVWEAHYTKAMSLLNAGKLDKALESFKEAGDYSDTAQQIKNIEDYTTAEKHYKDSDYIAARPIYATLGDYLDSAARLDEINKVLYAEADQKEKAGNLGGAYETWAVISNYSDCSEKMAAVESNYQSALAKWESGDKTGAETDLVALAGWSDADAKLETLREEIADDAVTAEDYDTALAYYAKLKDQTEAVTTKITAATQGKNYQEAISALDSSNLKTAYAKFVAAGDYSDAAVRAAQLDKYIKANEAMTTGAYSDARAAYVELGDFLDSEKNLETCNKALYDSATAQMESGDIAGAYETFSLISGYKDSAEITAKVNSDYQAALDLWEKGDKTGAESTLVTLAGWNDVDAKLETLREEIADDAAEAGDYDTALSYYAKLANRTEALEAKVTAATQAKAYKDATAALASGDLKTAYVQFVAAGEHEDAAEQAANLGKYITANADMESGQYMKARTAYKALGDYLESEKNLETCNAALYQEAAALMENGDVAGAYVAYSHISDYSDSAAKVEGIKADYDAAAMLLEEGKYDEANAAFLALKNYSDSADQAKESLYQKAAALAADGQFAEATSLYTELGNYADSADKANETRYNHANAMRESGDLQGAAEEYEMLGEYSDAPQQLVQVSAEIANRAMEDKDYATALTAFQHLEQTDEIKAKEYELAQACYEEGYFAEATSAYEMLGQYELSLSKLPIARYAWADQLFNEGKYAEAAEQFAILGEMTDSAERAKESIYQLANQQLEAKEYDTAKATFQTIKSYNDADTMAQECDYRKASNMLADSEYKNAQTIFEALGTYSDSATRAKQCVYEQADALYAEADYAGAEKLYASVDYEDSDDKAKQCVYNRAELLFAAGEYAEAAKVYGSVEYEDSADKAKLSTYNQAEALFAAEKYAEAKTVYASVDYGDSKDKAKLSAYREAEVCYAGGSYADAEELFAKLGDYSDSADRAKDSHVQQGNVLMQAGDYAGAIKFYESVDYGDSATLAAKCHYELGQTAITSGDMDSAVSEYAQATVLQEAQDAMIAVAKDYMAINETKKAIQVLWVLRESEVVQNLLKEIGDLKRQSGNVDEALLVYCTLGEGTLLENPETISVTGYNVLDTCLDACKLLPDDLHFSDVQRYTFASAAFETNQYDLATTVFNAIADYEDAPTQALESQYRKAMALLAESEYDSATATFNAIEAYKDASTQALESQYQKGIRQLADHDYDAAITTFKTISDYKDARDQLTESRYQKASSLYQSGDFSGANEIFTSLDKYKDAENMSIESRYQYGCSLIKQKKYEEAIHILLPLNGYKDVFERVTSNKKLRFTLLSNFFQIGDAVTFGQYEEDELKWYVIKSDDNKRYLITTRNVDKRQFNSRNSYQDRERGKVYHWGTSDLRSWLNSTFYGKAFTSTQKQKIVSIPAKYEFVLWKGSIADWHHKYSYDDNVSGIYWIPNFSQYDLPTDIREKLEADYWTGGVSNKSDVYEVSDNNSDSDYSFVYPAYTMTNYGCPMTEKHGVRPVIQIDLATFTDKDLEELWPKKVFNQLKAEESTEYEDDGSYEILKVSSKGKAVKRLQQALIDKGFLSGEADGDYGNKTAEAVKKAQKAFGTDQTGIADDAFQKKLFSLGEQENDENSTDSEVTAKLEDGWYISEDGKYGIQLSEPQKTAEGVYTISFKVRVQASGTVIYDTKVDIETDGVVTLAKENTIQNFTEGSDGKYSFRLLCEKQDDTSSKTITKKIKFKPKDK